MGTVKDLVIGPISSREATAFVKRHHYSGKVAANSQLHFGVFLDKRLGGVMQFGPSLDKRRVQSLVSDTPWNGFLELNRMAFSDFLPRNSESRALSIAFKMIKKHYPHIQWIISFADGTQCGDGTIYRATGFILTQIKKNTTIWKLGDEVFTDLGVRLGKNIGNRLVTNEGGKLKNTGAASMKQFKEMGAEPLPGFQLRYIYFLDKSARGRLTVPELPYSEIKKVGASMYKGVRRDD